jgi:hypothetical protein
MPSLAYVFRRGAVYHFRQRLPAPLAKKLSLSHLSLSLRTTNQRVARQRTARLAALASKVFRMMDELPTVTRNQLNAIFREFASDLLLDLEAVAAKKTEDPDFDIDFARIFDQAAGWAERLRAAQGIRAKLDPATRREMTDHGHGTDTHFELVELFLEDPDPANETSDLECQDYLEGVGAEVTEENIRLTRRTLHRAAAMAYFAVESAGAPRATKTTG